MPFSSISTKLTSFAIAACCIPHRNRLHLASQPTAFFLQFSLLKHLTDKIIKEFGTLATFEDFMLSDFLSKVWET